MAINGFCIPPVCWTLNYNFAAAGILVIKPKDVPNWAKGLPMPMGSFPAMEAAFIAQTNAGATLRCDQDCICVRLHKKAITVALPPQRIGPHPLGKTDIYMTGITATGFWGMCLLKHGGVRIKKGDKWVYPDELPGSDLLSADGSQGGSAHKKKAKKRRKAARRSPRR